MSTLAILFIVAACVLFTIEAFIPGFGVAGILGILAFIGSVIITILYVPFGIYYVFAEVAVFGLVIYIFWKFIFKSRFQRDVVLNDTLQENKPDVDVTELLGKEGVVTAPLKPTGFADFNGTIIEVSSEGVYISERSRVKVVDSVNNKPIVRIIKEPNAN